MGFMGSVGFIGPIASEDAAFPPTIGGSAAVTTIGDCDEPTALARHTSGSVATVISIPDVENCETFDDEPESTATGMLSDCIASDGDKGFVVRKGSAGAETVTMVGTPMERVDGLNGLPSEAQPR